MLCLAVTASAQAQGPFDDVPDDHLFVDDIQWMSDNKITFGCNPPENTMYCPEDNTTRGQEAAFFHRFARSRAVDAGWLDGRTVEEFLLKDEFNEFVSNFIDDNPDAFKGEKGDPGASAGEAITLRSETSEPAVAGAFAESAACVGDEDAIAGGIEAAGATEISAISESFPAGGVWNVEGVLLTGGGSLIVHVTCLDPTP